MLPILGAALFVAGAGVTGLAAKVMFTVDPTRWSLFAMGTIGDVRIFANAGDYPLQRQSGLNVQPNGRAAYCTLSISDADGKQIVYVNTPLAVDFSKSTLKRTLFSSWIEGDVVLKGKAIDGSDVTLTYHNDNKSLPTLAINVPAHNIAVVGYPQGGFMNMTRG